MTHAMHYRVHRLPEITRDIHDVALLLYLKKFPFDGNKLICSYFEDFSLILQLKIRDIVIHVDIQYVVYVIEDMVYFDCKV